MADVQATNAPAMATKAGSGVVDTSKGGGGLLMGTVQNVSGSAIKK